MMRFAHQLTAVDILIGGVIACMAIFLLGAIGNAVLKHNGFGTVINGVLLFTGMALGVAARAVTIGFQ